jgi:hypothetical protein
MFFKLRLILWCKKSTLAHYLMQSLISIVAIKLNLALLMAHFMVHNLAHLMVQVTAPPANPKDTPRPANARFHLDLDDGVMINSAALWPLLEPQWTQPKKWWSELCNAEGKKDYDWSHLAARYFPQRVDEKTQQDPSLAVAHGCFWKYHPAKAYEWELRLQDEIAPDFTIDEIDSEQLRQDFIQQNPVLVAELTEKEQKRRDRKYKKQTPDWTIPPVTEPE